MDHGTPGARPDGSFRHGPRDAADRPAENTGPARDRRRSRGRIPAAAAPHAARDRNSDTYLAFDRLEAWDADDGSGQAGKHRAGSAPTSTACGCAARASASDSHTESADLEALYGRSVSPWWDVVAGVSHDFGPASPRPGPRSASRAGAVQVRGRGHRLCRRIRPDRVHGSKPNTTLLLTNRLILQPLRRGRPVWQGRRAAAASARA